MPPKCENNPQEADIARRSCRTSHRRGERMMTATTQREESTAAGGDRLLLAIELGRRQWKLGFTRQRGQQIGRRTLLTEAWDACRRRWRPRRSAWAYLRRRR